MPRRLSSSTGVAEWVPLHELTFVTGCSNFKLGSVKGGGCGGVGVGVIVRKLKKLITLPWLKKSDKNTVLFPTKGAANSRK